jgi:hypothetical protein
VLILDFDDCLHPAGVLTSQHQYTVRVKLFMWLPVLTGLLQEHPDVFLAVHSTWRDTYPANEFGDMHGDLGPRYLGITPKWLPPLGCHQALVGQQQRHQLANS